MLKHYTGKRASPTMGMLVFGVWKVVFTKPISRFIWGFQSTIFWLSCSTGWSRQGTSWLLPQVIIV